jgi:phage baseplate assembly protein W
MNTNIPKPPIGWPLLPVPDKNGELHYPTLAQSVRDSLQVILSTRPGEQLMTPAFGAGLTDFIGQPDTITTRRRIYDRVAESIGRWEQRIIVDRIEISDVSSQIGLLRIEIAYRLRRTGEAQTIGVSLKMESLTNADSSSST